MAWKDSGDGSGFGSFYRCPAAGMYKGRFLGTEETTRKKYQSEEIEEAYRWLFEVRDMLTGEPIFYIQSKDEQGNFGASVHVPAGTPESEPAITDRLTSTATGPNSTARKYARALSGLPLEGAISGAEFGALLKSLEGTEVYLTFGPVGSKGRIGLSSFIPIGAAATAAA